MGSPSRKKRPTVPRLGLSMSFKGDASSGRSNRDAFALGDLGLEDDEHRMLNRGMIQH